MNKLKRFIIGNAIVLWIIGPIGHALWEHEQYYVYAYEFNIWKYKIVYNPIVEEELINAFIETHVFDAYVNEYNKQERINIIVSRLGYERIGIINKDNNFIYTIYLNELGKIYKVVDGFDDADFIAEVSISRIGRLARDNRFEDITKEVKVPFKVKLKILKVMWF